MTLLRVENISKAYGHFWAVDHVSFELAEGQMLALIGPNGAGKTTTFNIISGQIKASAGAVFFNGENVLALSAEQIWALGVGRTFQTAEVFLSLTVIENVQLALQMAHHKKMSMWNNAYFSLRKEAESLLQQVGMLAYADEPSSEISYGDVKRLELAMALAHHPTLLLMDEPTAGMSPDERVAMMALTQTIAKEKNMAVLFTEHSMDVVFAFAERIIVMASGSIIASGTPNEIKNNATVKSIYLGEVIA